MENIPNPVLKDLGPLIGEWNIEITFPNDPPGTVFGRAIFEWFDDGSFLLIRSGNNTGGPPQSVSMVSRDDTLEAYTMLYFDDRGVSRIYNMSFKDNVWKQWREAPNFLQRFTGTLSADGKTISAEWQNSPDGVIWAHDFYLTYTKVR
jgi:hypothetical protein